ncbi:MAG: mannose-1-phosphate guanylyltransferase/mannose-6-phosphate isomerase [Sphingorhabdus sp.]|uniref:mannose-1-phosphate guanylyltransferase/mannose-6-phosphate isomerase n=1 Tax=Sphingorhabdus sp. TaxID=1902408 RepID=UPI003CB83AC5
MKITPVILSGGGGTRLWPMSTPECPKQFLKLAGDATMFQMTLARVMDREFFNAPLIVGNAAHAEIIAQQANAAGVPDASIILEPCARNTAPAIALAALAVDDVKAPLLVMPSDHLVAEVPVFHAAIMSALPLVEDGWLVTFGITPTAPETGYGYIRVGDELTAATSRVERFVEKPDTATAQAMIDAGNHAWNGGIFLFRADIYLGWLASLAPDILHAAQKAMEQAEWQGVNIHPQEAAFAASPSDSIDYAVMEKADRVAVAPVSMGWSDVGSWDSLYEISAHDAAGNSLQGNTRLIDSHNNLVRSDGLRINLIGAHDLIVVAHGNEVLILPRGHSQNVKKFSS